MLPNGPSISHLKHDLFNDCIKNFETPNMICLLSKLTQCDTNNMLNKQIYKYIVIYFNRLINKLYFG